MQLINSWKEKSQHRKEEEIKRMASDYITLSDFEGKLYVAFQGNPLVVIDENLPASDIFKKLQKIRSNYINANLKNQKYETGSS